MPQTQAKAQQRSGLWLRILKKLAVILVVGAIMVWVVETCAKTFDRSPQPAGFVRGMFHGALMPMALPNLAIGRDVTIYTTNNTGRPYKLGYTVGVNGCGLIFFGAFFWRLSRLRRRLRAEGIAE